LPLTDEDREALRPLILDAAAAPGDQPEADGPVVSARRLAQLRAMAASL
jgi:hypothetical protein